VNTLAEEKTYCLMVIGNNMMVLHAIMEPFELQALGGKFITFAGDICKVVNQTIHPDLVELSGVTSCSGVKDHFATKAVPVLNWDQINMELESEENMVLVAQAGPSTAEGTAPTVDVHQVLPVPPLIVALYLKPTPESLCGIIPENKQDNYKPLFDFMRQPHRMILTWTTLAPVGMETIGHHSRHPHEGPLCPDGG